MFNICTYKIIAMCIERVSTLQANNTMYARIHASIKRVIAIHDDIKSLLRELSALLRFGLIRT